jgi:hypothetical protein
MLSIQEIRDKYGYMSSFALWKKIDETKKPKYGVGDIEHFENLEEKDINRNIILVGLNISGKGFIDNPFENFHNSKSTSHDYKIRFAIQDTIFSGAYMTDIVSFCNKCSSIFITQKSIVSSTVLMIFPSTCSSQNSLSELYSNISK